MEGEGEAAPAVALHVQPPAVRFRERAGDEQAQAGAALLGGVEGPRHALEGLVVGFLSYKLDPDDRTAEVILLAVHPDHQNRGIGTALNEFALRAMQAAGMRMVRVETGGDPGHAGVNAPRPRGRGALQPALRLHRLGHGLAEHPRQKGEMIVLHKDNGIFPLGFLDNSISETLIDRHILLPIAGSENGTHMGNMAKRP